MEILSDYKFLRFFLPGYIIIFVFWGLVIKTISFRKKYKTDPLVEVKADRLQKTIALYKVAILLTGFLTILLYSFFPSYYWVVIPFNHLDIPAIKISGVLILIASMILVRHSQNYMKQSWRVGVMTSEKTPLIITGIYRWSRNPIALGMILTIAGIFIVIPNAITFTCFWSGLIIANIRIVIEEEHLCRVHGSEYKDYCSKTRKWL